MIPVTAFLKRRFAACIATAFVVRWATMITVATFFAIVDAWDRTVAASVTAALIDGPTAVISVTAFFKCRFAADVAATFVDRRTTMIAVATTFTVGYSRDRTIATCLTAALIGVSTAVVIVAALLERQVATFVATTIRRCRRAAMPDAACVGLIAAERVVAAL
jgi:hypothetical protein